MEHKIIITILFNSLKLKFLCFCFVFLVASTKLSSINTNEKILFKLEFYSLTMLLNLVKLIFSKMHIWNEYS